jgi:hypothetical protein
MPRNGLNTDFELWALNLEQNGDGLIVNPDDDDDTVAEALQTVFDCGSLDERALYRAAQRVVLRALQIERKDAERCGQLTQSVKELRSAARRAHEQAIIVQEERRVRALKERDSDPFGDWPHVPWLLPKASA